MLRAQGFLEHRLSDVTDRTGTEYNVTWQDYDTGAPITAQMVAEKIDIGSMGDYPMLINGSKTQANERARTEIVSVTGYNPKGALNMVVVSPDSPAQTLTDLKGQKVSASVGSAGHGMLVQALTKAGVDLNTGVEVLNQQPQVGASALESGQVQALSQFVAWPGLLVFQDKARLLYDGAELDYPTLHGVVVRRAYAADHPEVLDAFLHAQLDVTEFLNDKPLEAARIVAEGSGLPQEVVYLYNGPAAPHELMRAVEVSFIRDCAEMAARSSLTRTESRWGLYHDRADLTQRDDEGWRYHLNLRKDSDGSMTFVKRPVAPYFVAVLDLAHLPSDDPVTQVEQPPITTGRPPVNGASRLRPAASAQPPSPRIAAVLALELPSVPELAEFLADADAGVRRTAVATLVENLPDGYEIPLIGALADADANVRRAAADGAREAVEVLSGPDLVAAQVHSADPVVRAVAIYVLAARRAGGEEVYRRALDDVDHRVRIEGVRALVRSTIPTVSRRPRTMTTERSASRPPTVSRRSPQGPIPSVAC